MVARDEFAFDAGAEAIVRSVAMTQIGDELTRRLWLDHGCCGTAICRAR